MLAMASIHHMSSGYQFCEVLPRKFYGLKISEFCSLEKDEYL